MEDANNEKDAQNVLDDSEMNKGIDESEQIKTLEYDINSYGASNVNDKNYEINELKIEFH